jgi:uncharacterized protein (TIGR04255 family)
MSNYHPKYKRPPIIERLVSVRARVKQEVFDAGFDEWREWVENEFPVYEPLKRWKLNLKETNGIPTEIAPELQLTPRFSEKSSKKGFGWSIRCPSDQFTMNMHSSHHENRSFSDLRARFPTWLEKWVEHFQVTDFVGLTVHYVNILDQTTVPAFFDEHGLDITKVLNIFFQIPGGNEEFTSPLNCKVTIKLLGEPGGELTIHAMDRQNVAEPSLILNLIVTTPLKERQNIDEIMELVDWCHDRIVERFEVILTDEAKKSFEPFSA